MRGRHYRLKTSLLQSAEGLETLAGSGLGGRAYGALKNSLTTSSIENLKHRSYQQVCVDLKSKRPTSVAT